MLVFSVVEVAVLLVQQQVHVQLVVRLVVDHVVVHVDHLFHVVFLQEASLLVEAVVHVQFLDEVAFHLHLNLLPFVLHLSTTSTVRSHEIEHAISFRQGDPVV